MVSCATSQRRWMKCSARNAPAAWPAAMAATESCSISARTQSCRTSPTVNESNTVVMPAPAICASWASTAAGIGQRTPGRGATWRRLPGSSRRHRRRGLWRKCDRDRRRFPGAVVRRRAGLAYRAGWRRSLRYALALPVRDLLLPVLWVAALSGRDFVWRGNPMTAGRRPARRPVHIPRRGRRTRPADLFDDDRAHACGSRSTVEPLSLDVVQRHGHDLGVAVDAADAVDTACPRSASGSASCPAGHARRTWSPGPKVRSISPGPKVPALIGPATNSQNGVEVGERRPGPGRSGSPARSARRRSPRRRCGCALFLMKDSRLAISSSRPGGGPLSPLAHASNVPLRDVRVEVGDDDADAACRWRSPSTSRVESSSARFSQRSCCGPEEGRVVVERGLPVRRVRPAIAALVEHEDLERAARRRSAR